MNFDSYTLHCPNCKERWSVRTFPEFELPKPKFLRRRGSWGFWGEHGSDRYRRFRLWIRWVNEQDEEDVEKEFSDLESDSDDDDEPTPEANEPYACSCSECDM